MLCTFCGTENRPEHKFCGICGVRLERRQVERRSQKGGISTKCTGCGYVNDPGLKFCGMCGTRERRMQDRRGDADGPHAAAIANAQLPSPDARNRATTLIAGPADREAAVSLPRRGEPAILRNSDLRSNASVNNVPRSLNISGPSFLGLNSQVESSEGEYLLEEEPSGGALRKLLLLVVLAAIIGLVFVQWRSSFKANPKPVPAKTDPSSGPAPAPQGGNQPQGSTSTAQPAEDTAKSSSTGVNTDSGVAATDAKDAKDPKAAKDPKTGSATQSNENDGSANDGSSKDSSAVEAAAAAELPADGKPASADSAPPASAVKPLEDARIPDYKPSAALVRAQQYIRGHGVQQNCEQGLLYLHAATDKNDPGAAIQMAALYSSGLCVKQDRVMAYRWFNSAHELQPGNMYIQKNMDQLWAQMTTQERRLAGY